MFLDSADGKLEVRFNFYTLYIYELEFNGHDLIKDVYGNGTVTMDGGELAFDFASVNWSAITKAIWAGARCANPSLPRFAEWASRDNGIDLFSAAPDVIGEINKELFRFGVAAVSE